MKRSFFAPLLIVLCLFWGVFLSTAHAQEIHLDKMQKCGDLFCYPSLKEPNVYYYLPDRPRLAVKDGKPQFSFLKYARTEKTGKAGIGQAEGGGIVHFLVTYGADQGRVKQAEKDLQAKNPQALIAGPIVYRKGSFALVTSFKEGNETSTKTVAVGKAPLMEGQKAAVSMALTREGAELLWESFRSATPDISLVFDMEFAGVREPYEATLEADWSRINNHHRVKAGFQYSWFGADVDLLFQELRQSGAVKITTKGESAALDKILDSANNKLLQAMFDPAPTDDLSRAAAERDGFSSLNQAVQMLRSVSGSGSSGQRPTQSGILENRPSLLQLAGRLVHSCLAVITPAARADVPELMARLRRAAEIAQEYYMQERFEQALEQYLEMDRISELLAEATSEQRSRTIRGTTAENIAICFNHLDQLSEAHRWYLEAAARYGAETEDGRRAQASAERVIAAARQREENVSGGAAASPEHQRVAEGTDELMTRLRRTMEIGQEYFLQERFEQSLEQYLEMDRISEALADVWSEGVYRRLRGMIAYNIAVCFQMLDQLSEAQRWYREAAARYGPDTEEGGRAQSAAEVMAEPVQKASSGKGGGVGGGRQDRAEQLAEAARLRSFDFGAEERGALPSGPRPSQDEGAVQAAQERGLDLWLEERYGEALSEYRQALSLLERMDDPPAHRLVFVHSRIAEILSIRIPDPDYVQAARHYRRAAAIAGHDTDAGGAALRNAEWCDSRASSLAAGSDRGTEHSPALQETVSQEVPAEDQSRQAFLRGNEHFQAGRFERALEDFREAMTLYEGIPNPLDDRRAALRNNVGQALFRLEQYSEAESHLRQAAELWGSATAEGQRAIATAELAEQRSREGYLQDSGTGEVGRESPTEAAPAASASEAYNQARRLYEEARSAGFQVDAVRRAIEAYEAYQRDHAPTGERAGEVSGRIRMLRERLPAGAAATALGEQTTEAAPATAASRGTADLTVPRLLDPFSDRPSSPASSSTPGSAATVTSRPSERSAAVSPSATGPGTQPAREGERPGGTTGSAARSRSDGRPGFSLVASYQMKQIKRSGKLVYNMNHFRTENQAFAMTENIGDLYQRYGRDPRVFRAVTIDDPVFKQREILVTLDGQDAATFTEHLNFVTVKLEKRHQSGEVTSDEVVITPAKFNEGGNAFSLGYGYKGDDDRAAWLDYRYQALWSFHGGVEFRTPWENTDSPMLAVQPPHRYRTVTVEGDGAGLTAVGVRHAVITLSSVIGGRSIKKQATIRNQGPAPALMVEIPEDPEKPQIEAAITWYLSGGGKVTAPPLPVEGSIIYWDELPKNGV